MIPGEVLQTTFAGCGVDLQALRESPFLRNAVKAEAGVGDSQELPIATTAHRMGHFLFGQKLNPFMRWEGCVPSRYAHLFKTDVYDFQERVLIRYLGQVIVDAAKARLSPKLIRLAEEFRQTSDEGVRLRILSRACHHLISGKKSKNLTSMASMLCQPRTRVLPLLYHTWSWNLEESDRAPNCLSKGQLLAAFLELAGVTDVMSAVPITFSNEFREIAQGGFAEKFLRYFEALSYFEARDQAFLGSMRNNALAARRARERASYPHFPVAVRLELGRWVLLDPNGSALPLPVADDFETDRIYRTLRGFEQVLPGVSIAHSSLSLEALALAHWIDTAFEIARDFLTDYHRLRPQGEDAVAFVEQSKILTLLINLTQRNGIIKRTRQKKRQKNSALTAEARSSPCKTRRELALYILSRTSYEKEGLSIGLDSPQKIEEILRRELLDRIIPGIPYRFLYFVSEAVHLAYPEHPGWMCHPRLEFGNLKYQLACYTLYHVGVDLGLGDETVNGLMSHWFGLYVVHNAASVLLRHPDNWKEKNPRAAASRKILEHMPFKLRSSFSLLSHLNGGNDNGVTDEARR